MGRAEDAYEAAAMKIALRDNWITGVVTLAIVFGIAFCSISSYGQTPTEPPQRWRAPRDLLRTVFPDSVLTPAQLENLIDVFRQISATIYNSNRFAFEAIRGGQYVQHDTIWLIEMGAIDSVLFTLPIPLSDTNYAVAITDRIRYVGTYNPTVNYRTTSSFWIINSVVRDVLYDVIVVP